MKILSFGDNPKSSTGYGQVWDNLLPRWVKAKPDWEFKHVGWQNQERPQKREEGYWMLPTGKMEYGPDVMYPLLMEYKPDYVITLCDIGLHAGYTQAVDEARKNGWRGKWIAYAPVDTHGWCPLWDEILKHPDINVTMAGFGERMYNDHNVKNICIPHGVDLETFKPVENRDEVRERFGVKDKFVVGFVGRNQLRKMIDRLVMGFARFAKGKDDVKLLLHTDDFPQGIGWDMPILRGMFQLHGKSLVTKRGLDSRMRQTIPPGTINEIYNLMDIFGYATGGEGFGLPGIECQAAGVPLLMADNSTAEDLCKKENRIPILKDIHGRDCKFIGTNGVFFKYPDDIAMAKMFEVWYKAWKTNGLIGERKDAREFAETYNWEKFANRWIELFENGK